MVDIKRTTNIIIILLIVSLMAQSTIISSASINPQNIFVKVFSNLYGEECLELLFDNNSYYISQDDVCYYSKTDVRNEGESISFFTPLSSFKFDKKDFIIYDEKRWLIIEDVFSKLNVGCYSKEGILFIVNSNAYRLIEECDAIMRPHQNAPLYYIDSLDNLSGKAGLAFYSVPFVKTQILNF